MISHQDGGYCDHQWMIFDAVVRSTFRGSWYVYSLRLQVLLMHIDGKSNQMIIPWKYRIPARNVSQWINTMEQYVVRNQTSGSAN